MKYRSDIDGLRGLAVIVVLLFHVGFSVSGGFIGVDIFFVISGFLITGILLNAAEKNNLSVIDFYKRRIIRLYPALCLTLILTLVAGFLIFDPNLFSELAKSSLFAVASISNIYFRLDGGYFGLSSDLKPLLHTWSLGVEQQFYIIWPFVILIGMHFGRRFLFVLLLIITLVSLALSQHYVSMSSAGSYFYMPMRMFELSLGGLLSFSKSKNSNETDSNILCAFGILLIIYSAMKFSDLTPFPGINALIPCAGAMLCIYYGNAQYLGKILNNRVMVFVGTISYSLYLVHWPVIVFYKYFIFIKPNLFDQIAMIAISFFIAIPIYYFCEHSCQQINKKKSNAMPVLILTLTSVFAICISSKYIYSNSGLPWRINENYRSMVSDSPKFHEKYYGGAGYLMDQTIGNSSRKVVVAGDSYAQQLLHGMDKYISSDFEILGQFAHGCIFGEGITRMIDNKPRQVCIDSYEKMVSLLNGNTYPLIIAFSWDSYSDITIKNDGEKIKFKSDEDYYSFIYKNLQGIRERIGKDRRMVIVGNPPLNNNHPGSSISGCMFRPEYIKTSCMSMSKFKLSDSKPNRVNEYLLMFAKNNPNTYFINPSDALCKNGICNDIIDNKIIYSDGVHLSIFGSDILINRFKDKIISLIE
ncbi:acyltransferase family protein [Yersinia intermedia]|uniref:acyltransferase family protein n=1 Tax=Yersinia intermedia TaxID=631 RepID=UPI0005DFDAA8|nr:acyltransferase family protein [Yersinia intermedia]CQJ56560.1 acyltransferase family protein [Yersinia intermedia]